VGKREWKFEHLICDQADGEVFKRQCAALEANIPGLKKGKLYQDVDGSDYQIYTLKGAEIEVGNDTYLDHVTVLSDVDLLPYFQQPNPAAPRKQVNRNGAARSARVR
jgi:hypothetical protein